MSGKGGPSTNPPPNHVPSSSGCDAYAIFPQFDDAVRIASDNQFKAGFARAVWIKTPKAIIFAIRPNLLLVLVNLIRRDDNDSDRSAKAYSFFQHVDSPHNIHIERFIRVIVAVPDKRLCRQMKNDVWLGGEKRLLTTALSRTSAMKEWSNS